MSELVPTRVVEICPGEWVVQFAGGLGRSVTPLLLKQKHWPLNRNRLTRLILID